MGGPRRLSGRVIYQRVLWAATAASWAASVIVAAVLLAEGVKLDVYAILLWLVVVVHVSIGAMIVSSIPNAESIAARSYAAGRSDAGDDELADRRRG